MPTYHRTPHFKRDYEALSDEDKEAFWRAVRHFVDDLDHGLRVRHSLRPKRIKGQEGIWEITWANNGRATFEYGPPVRSGEAHIIWRRVGTHSILREP